MDLISEFSQLARFLKEQVLIYGSKLHAPCSRMMAGLDVSRTEIVNFLPYRIDFLFIFGQCGDNSKFKKLFLTRNVGVTERTRSLNASKVSSAIPVVIFSIIGCKSVYKKCSIQLI